MCVYMVHVCITRPRLGVLDVRVSDMRLEGSAFALGAFVVHLLSEAPKSTDGGWRLCGGRVCNNIATSGVVGIVCACNGASSECL